MTTIAYRDGVMAADTAASWESDGGSYRTRQIKLHRAAGCVVGIAGDYYAGAAFLAWFEDEDDTEKPDPNSAGEFLALIADAAGKIWTANCFYTLVEEEGPYFAIGSGAPYALSGLRLGLSAEEAVAHASEFDTQTHGDITVERTKL